MKCRDIMTKNLEFCVATTTVDQVAGVMKEYNVGFIPVVEDLQSNRLVGVVTDRDLTVRVLASPHTPVKTSVKEVMTRPVITCSPDDDVSKAIQLMEEHMLRRLPIVDENQAILGVISEADIARRLSNRSVTAELVEAISHTNQRTQSW